MNAWEEELRQHFPSYLLPSAQVDALPREAAERFLARVTGRPDALRLLLATSVLAPVARVVLEFERELPLVARALPSRTTVDRVERDGSVRGRLDASATARRRIAGHPGRVVSSTPRTTFALPENELLVATAAQLVGLLRELEDRRVISETTEKSWARGLTRARRHMDGVLRAPPLSDVPRLVPAQLTAFHVDAARAARPAAYGIALCLRDAMRGLDVTDPAELAQLVAEGALAPIELPRRFEIAVLIRLGRCLGAALEARGFTMERSIIESARREVFAFHRGAMSVLVHYDQQLLPHACVCHPGLRHYLGGHEGLRPDITIEIVRDGARVRAAVADAKLSESEGYLEASYLKMLRYREDLGAHLGGWPKAILVASSGTVIAGAPRQEDEVVAVPWKDWVPEDVISGLLDGV
jgi:hypothetical protein